MGDYVRKFSKSYHEWIFPSNSLDLTYALFGLKQGSPLEELITWALVTQLEWDLWGLKEGPNRYILIQISDKNDVRYNFSDFQNLSVQVYPKIW